MRVYPLESVFIIHDSRVPICLALFEIYAETDEKVQRVHKKQNLSL